MTHCPPLRIVLYAPHFAEYSTRLALALCAYAKVLLVVNRDDRRKECYADLIACSSARLSVAEFDPANRVRKVMAFAQIFLRTLFFRADIFHMQEQPDRLSAALIRYIHRAVHVVLTVHDPTSHAGSDAEFAKRNAANRRLIRSAAQLFHVHGAYCRRELQAEVGNTRPIVATTHGVILVPDASQMRAPEPCRILMFGRMEAYKGLEVLMQAAERLQRGKREFRLVLAGRGPELDRLRSSIAGLDCVELLEGFITPEQAIVQFQRASVIVLPYLEATQSGVASAAFGNSRPVVASRVGGLVDIVRDGTNGLLVTPNDPEDLAEKLDRVLLDRSLLARLTRGALDTAHTHLSWDEIAGRVVWSYRRSLLA